MRIQHFLKMAAVLQITGWSRSTLWREVQGGRFPEPVPTTKQRVGWLENEIAEWQSKKIEERETRHARPMGPQAKKAAASARL